MSLSEARMSELLTLIQWEIISCRDNTVLWLPWSVIATSHHHIRPWVHQLSISCIKCLCGCLVTCCRPCLWFACCLYPLPPHPLSFLLSTLVLWGCLLSPPSTQNLRSRPIVLSTPQYTPKVPKYLGDKAAMTPADFFTPLSRRATCDSEEVGDVPDMSHQASRVKGRKWKVCDREKEVGWLVRLEAKRKD